MTTGFKIKSILILVAAVVVGLVGVIVSFNRPQEGIRDAESAIKMARSVEADQYAPELFRKAQSDFQSAIGELDKQDQRTPLFRFYFKAEQLLESAQEAAIEARTVAVSKQEQARAAGAAVDLAKIELKSTRKLLAWFTEKIGRTDAQSMTGILDKQEAELVKASELLAEEDFAGAKTVASSVMRQCSEIAGMIRNAT